MVANKQIWYCTTISYLQIYKIILGLEADATKLSFVPGLFSKVLKLRFCGKCFQITYDFRTFTFRAV